MSQDEFNKMLRNAIASGITGYFESKYSWEEVEKILDWAKKQAGI